MLYLLCGKLRGSRALGHECSSGALLVGSVPSAGFTPGSAMARSTASASNECADPIGAVQAVAGIDAQEAEEAPMQDHMVMDIVADGTQITHMITAERHVLPGVGWEFVWSEDGHGCVVRDNDSSEGEIIDLDDLFNQVLFTCPGTGEHWTLDRGVRVNLDMQASMHKLATVDLPVGASSANLQVQCAVFQRFRFAANRLYWSLSDLFKLMAIPWDQPSRWVWRCKDRWRATCKDVYGHDECHVILSNNGAPTSGAKAALPWRLRCLPFPALSTAALLHMTHRWTLMSRAKGGLEQKESREAADIMKRGMLAVIVGDNDTHDLKILLHGCQVFRLQGVASADERTRERLEGGYPAGALADTYHGSVLHSCLEVLVSASVDWHCWSRGKVAHLRGQEGVPTCINKESFQSYVARPQGCTRSSRKR